MKKQPQADEGKYMSTVRMGPKGQIVIPKEVREFYGLQPGDNLLLLAGNDKGIILLPKDRYMELFRLFASTFPPEELSS